MPRTGDTFNNTREIPASVEQVFAAFTDPARHARWWGPAGFTNTFNLREFESGGKWSYVMHGPDGRDYKNESVFEEVSPHKIVIEHVSGPNYRLTIGLAPSAKGTVVSWSQVFRDEGVAERIEKIVGPANEQNLDRLSVEVLKML